ncbi:MULTISPECIES: GlcG/HbpS family heme-binding protein [Rahnella]|uniref:GlcG/HbpS family heme-binding protein n=1 Tax=Rahnella TaxID=34037 RepID=UPI001AD890B8|nr:MULTISPECIES: heme-binding protein [Rahnella]MDF1897301.1 heme-binding protein [Rahnella contaminans]
MSQSDGARLIAAGERNANRLNAHVCVAVVDQSGMLLAFTRMDTAPPGCIDSSILKARAVALFRWAASRRSQ